MAKTSSSRAAEFRSGLARTARQMSRNPQRFAGDMPGRGARGVAQAQAAARGIRSLARQARGNAAATARLENMVNNINNPDNARALIAAGRR